MKNLLSPRELSRAVGVSESSLKRWVDGGQLHATRTAGGHRRIRLDEAIRFIRHTGLRLVAPEAIGMGELAAAESPRAADTADRSAFVTALLDGNGPLVRGMVMHAYLSGHTVAEIGDHVIAPAMHQMGELWRHDPKGIFIEHRATSLCAEALHHLRSLLPPRDSKAPIAIGGAMSGDIYALPTLMVGVTLAASGWNDTNLGADTPAESLLLAAQTLKPRLLWLSFSVAVAEEEATRQINRLAQQVEPMGTSVIVGGRHAPTRQATLNANVHLAATMAELAAFAAGLGSARTPRRKG